jgi:hypothetical protein
LCLRGGGNASVVVETKAGQGFVTCRLNDYNEGMSTSYILVRDQTANTLPASDVIQVQDDQWEPVLKASLVQAAKDLEATVDKASLLVALAELQELMDALKAKHELTQMNINTTQALLSLRQGRYERKLAKRR